MGSSENIQVRLTGRGLFVAHVTAGLLGTPSLFATLNFLHGLHTGKGKKIPVDDAEALRWQSMKEASDPLGLALTAVLFIKPVELLKDPRSVPASPHKLNSLTFIAPHIGSRLALNNRNLILQPPPGADYS